MSETEKGVRWWVRYVFVPLLGSGGIAALLIALIFKMDPSRSSKIEEAIESIQTNETHIPANETGGAKQLSPEKVDIFDIASLQKTATTRSHLPELIRGCSSGASSSCNNLGLIFYNDERGLEINQKKAAKLFKKSCEDGGVEGCANLARMHFYGIGVEKDLLLARGMSEQACSQFSPNGCNLLGVIYLDGLNISKDYTRAKDLFTKSCAGQFAKGCYNLGRIYNAGFGVKIDYGLASKYFGLSCDGGFSFGCYELGNMYGWGRGLEADKEKQLLFYKKSCDLGYGVGCRLAARELKIASGSTPEISELLKKGCEKGDGDSCTEFASESMEKKHKSDDLDLSVCPLKDKGCQIGAIYSWITNRNRSPYIWIDTNGQDLGIPKRYIENNGTIVIDISRSAVKDIYILHDSVQFKTKFASVLTELNVPFASIKAIYGKEDGKGLQF